MSAQDEELTNREIIEHMTRTNTTLESIDKTMGEVHTQLKAVVTKEDCAATVRACPGSHPGRGLNVANEWARLFVALITIVAAVIGMTIYVTTKTSEATAEVRKNAAIEKQEIVNLIDTRLKNSKGN